MFHPPQTELEASILQQKQNRLQMALHLAAAYISKEPNGLARPEELAGDLIDLADAMLRRNEDLDLPGEALAIRTQAAIDQMDNLEKSMMEDNPMVVPDPDDEEDDEEEEEEEEQEFPDEV